MVTSLDYGQFPAIALIQALKPPLGFCALHQELENLCRTVHLLVIYLFIHLFGWFFKAGFHCVAPAVLELTLTRRDPYV